jgi:thiamine biosynthesis lipoprotein
MSRTVSWRDWSCEVRLTLATGADADVAAGADLVRRVMDEVARSASRFRADSDPSRVNASAGSWVTVNPLTIELVDVALAAARRSGGAVDPTVGAHLHDAGYVDDIEQVRAGTPSAATRPSRPASWSSVSVDRELRRVGVPGGLRLDLGATAKAWAADEAAGRVRARLGHPVLVEIGGDLAVAGAAARPWQVDIAEVPGGPAYRVELAHGALATSSTLARRWTTRRGTEHHVIDPRTSRPACGPVRTATVWAPTAVAANTWSTASIVWGTTAAARLRDEAVDARLVDRDGLVTAIGAWPHDERVAA